MSEQRIESFRGLCLSNVHAAMPGRCLIIGEVAQTHDGSLGQAHAFIDAIANAGADAVKFQTHIAAAESTPTEPWRVQFSPQDDTRYEYWERMEFSLEQWRGLKQHADERGLLFVSSPFSLKAAELLDDIGMSVWKIASGEIGNTMLLDRIVKTGKPVILSSGMSGWSELEVAAEMVCASGSPLAVLQCTSAYPCPPEKIGLNLLEELRERFDCPIGLSDHSGNIFAGLAAATLGAEVLEIHICLSREMFGADVPASITTRELRQLVDGVRSIETMLANPVNKETAAEEVAPLRQIFTKSVYAGQFLSAGTVLGAAHLVLKKPGTGIPVSELSNVIGQRLRRNLQPDELLMPEDLEA